MALEFFPFLRVYICVCVCVCVCEHVQVCYNCIMLLYIHFRVWDIFIQKPLLRIKEL